MKIKGLYPKLTKEYILERVTQEEIMLKYLQIPVTPENMYGSAFCNPFRKDESPTCNYYYDDNGKLRMRDFGGDLLDRLYNMDVFDTVGNVYGIDSNNKQGFKIIQNIIAKDFNIHKYQNNQDEIQLLDTFLINQTNKKKKIRIIKVVPRGWNEADGQYWYKRYGVTSDTLKRRKVYPVHELWMEDQYGNMNLIYSYDYKNPAYAYYGGKEQEIHLWKIYFPLNRNPKFTKIISNKQFVQGFEDFLPTRVGVITKSYKDVMVLEEFGIQAVNLATEVSILSANQIFMLKMNCDIVISLLDYDTQGIKMANKLKKQYGIQPFMLTRGRYGKPDYGVKDISDFREQYGRDLTMNLIKQGLESLSDRIEDINNYRRSILWIYNQ